MEALRVLPRLLPGLVLLALLLAGCSSPAAELSVSGVEALEAPAARWLDPERVEVAVPVPVILVGFEAGLGEALAARLGSERVATSWSPVPRPFPPDPHASRLEVPVPLVAEGRFVVREAPAELAEALRARVPTWAVPEEDGLFDAAAAEAWLAGALREAGLLPEACCPGLVLLHLGDLGEHGWRASFENGYIQPVRYFGEREPFGVLDVSARKDPNGHPMVVSPPRPYTQPLAAGGEATLDALEQAARDALRYRLLHTPIVPMATAPCHGVTLILAIRATALTESLPAYPRAVEQTYVGLLRAQLENLTRPAPVHVDLKVLRLPQDDPPLEALTRGPIVNTVALSRWIDANWERYWAPHEGCEPYVSLMVQGDALEPGSSGVGLYAGNWTHRISVSLIGETSRLGWNQSMPSLGLSQGGGRQVEHRPGWFTYFWAHEAGHTFGMAHTQDYSDERGAGPSHVAFSTGLSAMGYVVQGPTSDFGAVDRATFQRHRAGWALFEARAAGLEDAPAFEEAMRRLGERDWVGAWQALLPALHPSGDRLR